MKVIHFTESTALIALATESERSEILYCYVIQRVLMISLDAVKLIEF